MNEARGRGGKGKRSKYNNAVEGCKTQADVVTGTRTGVRKSSGQNRGRYKEVLGVSLTRGLIEK